MLAISSPKRSRTSSIDAEVSSTVSCSSAAHSVSVSRRMPAQIRATPTGCTMKSSPDLRRWSAWCSQANTNASCTRVAVDLDRRVGGVLGDDREQVAEQPPLGSSGPARASASAAARSTGRLRVLCGVACDRRATCTGRLGILGDGHVLRVGDSTAGLKALLASRARTARAPRLASSRAQPHRVEPAPGQPARRRSSAATSRPSTAALGSRSRGRARRSTRRGSLTPVPLVDLERERRLDGLARRRPAGAPPVPNATARARAPPRLDREARVLAFAHRPRRRANVASASISDTPGLPRPNGASALQLLGQRHAQLARRRRPRRRARPAAGPRARARARRARRAPRERLHARALDLQARGRAMAAVAQQVLRAGRQAGEQVERLDRCAPSPCPSSPSSAISTTGRWWRSASREATIPITPGCQPSPASTYAARCAQRRDLRFGLEADAASRPGGARGWRGRARRAICAARAASLGEDQLERRVGAVQAPGGVQARRQREARPRARPRAPGRRARPPSARAARAWWCRASARRPRAHERAVLAEQRHDVGDRRQRHQVEILRSARAPRSPAAEPAATHRLQRLRELVGDRRRAEIRARDSRTAPGARSARPAARRRRAGRGGR